MPRGRIVPPTRGLGPRVASPRFPFPPPRDLQSTPGWGRRAIHGEGGHAVARDSEPLSPRLGLASFLFRSAQIGSSRPASLSAAVT